MTHRTVKLRSYLNSSYMYVPTCIFAQEENWHLCDIMTSNMICFKYFGPCVSAVPLPVAGGLDSWDGLFANSGLGAHGVSALNLMLLLLQVLLLLLLQVLPLLRHLHRSWHPEGLSANSQQRVRLHQHCESILRVISLSSSLIGLGISLSRRRLKVFSC